MPAEPRHAIIIGGSIAGLLAARALSDHFGRVTLLERDEMHDIPESRKGQPQTHHVHALLVRGQQVMERYFPGLMRMLAEGSQVAGDMGERTRWHCLGDYRVRFRSGLHGVGMSRPFLEYHIRRRVAALPNVTILDGHRVENLLATADGRRVTGVEVAGQELAGAGLVVDAGGRGSASPRWLERLGYDRPAESKVRIGVGYTTRLYRREPGLPGDPDWTFITPDAPREQRGGVAFPIEGGRWLVTLGGWHGDHAPADQAGFEQFARSLPARDIYDIVSRCEPVSDFDVHGFPSSRRRHYEKLARFPEGYLVAGDALCSFNPFYGQGMTVAALEVEALDVLLRERRGRLAGLAPAYFQRTQSVVNTAWRMALAEDLRYPQTAGPRPPGIKLLTAYMDRVHRATHHDPAVFYALLLAINLLAPPASLFRPTIAWRVLRSGPRDARRHRPAPGV